jgi:hypothetical protein
MGGPKSLKWGLSGRGSNLLKSDRPLMSTTPGWPGDFQHPITLQRPGTSKRRVPLPGRCRARNGQRAHILMPIRIPASRCLLLSRPFPFRAPPFPDPVALKPYALKSDPSSRTHRPRLLRCYDYPTRSVPPGAGGNPTPRPDCTDLPISCVLVEPARPPPQGFSSAAASFACISARISPLYGPGTPMWPMWTTTAPSWFVPLVPAVPGRDRSPGAEL